MFQRTKGVVVLCLSACTLIAAPAFGVTVTLDANSSISGTDPGVSLIGAWTQSTANAGFIGANYLHDGNTAGGKSVTFTPTLPSAGSYLVEARWTSFTNRATNASYNINFDGGSTGVSRNQQSGGGAWQSLGVYNFAAGSAGNVVLHNTAADGFVVADGMRFTTFTAPAPGVIANDNFESYPSGSNLNGGNGGAGWTDPWSTSAGHVTVQPITLVAPNGLGNGGAQAARVQPTVSIAADDNSIASRPFMTTTGPVYVGLLLRVSSLEQGDFINFQVTNGDEGNLPNTTGFGILNDVNNSIFTRVGQSGNAAGDQDLGPAVLEDRDYLLVAKFSQAANGQYERIDLFIDPTSLVEPVTPSLTSIGTQPAHTQLSLFNIRVNSFETDDLFFFDNLRISDTFAGAISAGAVPEPASVSLLMVGVAALLRRRRQAA